MLEAGAMMAVSKLIKRQARKNLKGERNRRQVQAHTWSYKVGDLVKIKGEKTWGIIVECIDVNSYCQIITSYGKREVLHKHLERIQSL